MKAFCQLILGLVLIILLLGCNKDSPEKPDPQPPDPEIPEFSIPAVSDMIVYEVNIRAFGPGSDFQAVIGRLDEIQQLSVNVIWLMPIHPIGEINSVNSPYSVQDYKSVNSEFGSFSGFKLLVDEAHKRNIAVVIDWVANHTAWDNAWIENKDWYTQDGSGNIVHPPGTNWLDVADLNFDNMDMRTAMIDAMNFWVKETNIDGFRCDAADWVPFDFWQQALGQLKGNTEKELILLAEGARDDHHDAGFQMTYGWDFYNRIKQVFQSTQLPQSLFSTHESEYAGLPVENRILRFTTNHDESAWDATPVVLFNGIDGALAASVVNTFMGGIPLVYGSQEVGTEGNVPFFSSSTINWSQNPAMLAEYTKMNEHFANSETARQTGIYPILHPDIVSFMKFSAKGKLFVLVNTGNHAAEFTVNDTLINTSWINVMNGSAIDLSTQIELQAYDYLILDQPSK